VNWRDAFVVTLAISIAAIACHEDEPRVAVADAAAEAGSPDVSILADGAGVDRAPGDADTDAIVSGLDGMAGDSSDDPGAAVQAKAYQFFRDLEAQFKARRVSCFGTPIALLNKRPAAVLPVDGVDPSLRLGLQRFDEAAAQTCLATLATISCARIADMLTRTGPQDSIAGVEVCRGVLSGTVAPGSFCLRTEDCQSPDQVCDGRDVCQVCTPHARGKLGDVCLPGAQDCPLGADCRPDPAPSSASSCQPLGRDGERCHEDFECVAGLFCARDRPGGLLDGVCSPEILGKACVGDWDCLYFHACVGAAPGKTGTCQMGKGVGEPCSIYDPSGHSYPYSDCADQLDCSDLDGKGLRCVSGVEVGATCGPVALSPKGGYVDCADSHCTATGGGQGSCERYRTQGESCRNEGDCELGLDCPAAGPGARTCTPPRHLVTGEKCAFGGGAYCTQDLYCAYPPEFDEFNPAVPSEGKCAPQRKVGETCRASIDRCEPLAKCIAGICKPC
jgi:hypothetical protein